MTDLQSVDILGGGPSGLYTAILLRRALPHLHVRVTEANPRDVTWGFGVVFSDQALGFLKADDPETHDLIAPQMERWRNMTLNHPKGRVVLDGIGFSAIGRLELLQILQGRAETLGAELRFGHFVEDLSELDADLVVGADGVNSKLREAEPEGFGKSLSYMTNRFAWFGADRPFDTLTQTFRRTDRGAMNAHHYRFTPDRSTFIIECDAASFDAHGFAGMDETQTAAVAEEVFADVLDGAKLIANKSVWRQFPKLWCDRWVSGNRVILGDAVHTAHFSIGSGTRLAMEDSIALVAALKEGGPLPDALARFEAARKPIAEKIVTAANTSCQWYEDFATKMDQHPLDFAFDYVTRSGRVNMERLRALSPQFMAEYDAHRAATITDPLGDHAEARRIGFDKASHPNCSATLWDNLGRNPDKLALTGPAGDVTYAELCAQAARWGNAFTAAGLAKGDRIPMLLDDTPAYPAAFFGAVRAGFVPVLLNTQSTADLVAYYIKDSGARIAVIQSDLTDRIDAASLDRVIVVGGDAPEGMEGADHVLDGQPDTLEAADTGPDDMAFWMYSSGSTGRPKGIVHLHHDMAYTQASFGAHTLKLGEQDICFSVPKMFFAYGFGNSVTFPFSVGATTLLLPGRPDPERILEMIETWKPTVFFGLPTLYTALCRAKGAKTRDLSSLRQCMSAAEILSEDVFAAWKELTGLAPIEGLGSTELLHVYLSNTADEQRLGSAGRPVPGYEIRLVDAEGNISETEGVMHVRGHSSAPCYWQRPDKTAETMQGDWLNTGDRFTVEDGSYYFQGRADDLVKVSGQWVWPLEVERCLNGHELVHEAAVLAHELPDRRTTLSAMVALRPGATGDDATAESLKAHVKTELLPHKYPRTIVFVPELPKTGTGKIDRQAVKAALQSTKETAKV